MGEDKKEKIILATLELAAERGLGNVSMNMIADRVGVRKASLYNHFSSKEELVGEMYRFLRGRAKGQAHTPVIDYGMLFDGRTAKDILKLAVGEYIRMSSRGELFTFYKVIYSERSIQSMAAKIMAEETEKMILATKQLFYAMAVHRLLHFKNADMSAVSFAMTVHGLIDYGLDLNADEPDHGLLYSYIDWFCDENTVKE